MAIAEIFADETYGVLDSANNTRGQPDYQKLSGAVTVAMGKVANAASDNDTSKYRLVKLPSNCILLPQTKIDLQSWGYAAATLGLDTDEDALLASVTISGLSAPSEPIAYGGSKWNKYLWEQLGLSEDPGTELEISIHTAADATGAGSATFEFWYLTN